VQVRWSVVIVTTLKVYGDESADEKATRVFTVTGIVGTEHEWSIAMQSWLRRTRGLPFHAKECESEFARTPDDPRHQQNLDLNKDLSIILAESPLQGIAVSIDLKSFKELLPDLLPDVAYYKCFQDVVGRVAMLTDTFNRTHSDRHLALEFTFDSRLQSDGTAGQMYTAFRTRPEWAAVTMFDTKVVFEGGQEPRLEMSDLYARETMKELDRKLFAPQRAPRRSFQALQSARKPNGNPKFLWSELDREYCQRWGDSVKSPDMLSAVDEYRQWLIDTGRKQGNHLHDTIVNRSLFFTRLAHREAEALKRAKSVSSEKS